MSTAAAPRLRICRRCELELHKEPGTAWLHPNGYQMCGWSDDQAPPEPAPLPPPPLAEPDGCRHCNIPEREHYQRWKPPVGWHGWTVPTDEQRKARMLARRTQRLETT